MCPDDDTPRPGHSYSRHHGAPSLLVLARLGRSKDVYDLEDNYRVHPLDSSIGPFIMYLVMNVYGDQPCKCSQSSH